MLSLIQLFSYLKPIYVSQWLIVAYRFRTYFFVVSCSALIFCTSVFISFIFFISDWTAGSKSPFTSMISSFTLVCNIWVLFFKLPICDFTISFNYKRFLLLLFSASPRNLLICYINPRLLIVWWYVLWGSYLRGWIDWHRREWSLLP